MFYVYRTFNFVFVLCFNVFSLVHVTVEFFLSLHCHLCALKVTEWNCCCLAEGIECGGSN